MITSCVSSKHVLGHGSVVCVAGVFQSKKKERSKSHLERKEWKMAPKYCHPDRYGRVQTAVLTDLGGAGIVSQHSGHNKEKS